MVVFQSLIKDFHLLVPLNGRNQTIKFGSRMYSPYGFLTVNNEQLEKALLEHPLYGKTFKVVSADKPMKELEPVKEYLNVRRTQEANRILKNEYNVHFTKLQSKEDTLRIAKELNISFPHLV